MNTSTSEPLLFKFAERDPRLAEWLKAYPVSVFSEHSYQSIELMERYSIELAGRLLDELGLISLLQDWRSPEELCQVRSFQPGFRFALNWILRRLDKTGCLEMRHDGETPRYHLRGAPKLAGIDQLRAMGISINPANVATLDLLDHAANLYPAVARGEQSGEAALFDSHGIGLWLNYFSNDNLTYAVNNWVGGVVAANRLSDRTRLRILELGAGAGSGTEILLHCLEERGLLRHIERYVVTEPNAFFRRRAQREVSRHYPNVPMEWRALDINLSWENQEIARNSFDLVYGVNVLHVSKNLAFTLNQARSSLADHGWLVMGECLRPFADQAIYPELMFQILESFTDVELDPEVRPNPGFLTAEQWRRAFVHAGIQRVEVAPDVEKIHRVYPHFFTGAICGQDSASGNLFG